MKKSKWHGKPCPVCEEGVLHDDIKLMTQGYKGHEYKSRMRGEFCDKCAEAVMVHDAVEETAWLEFRNQVDQQVAGG